MNKHDNRQQSCLRALADDELLEAEASKLLTQNYPLLSAAPAQTWFVITSHEEAKILTGNLHFATHTEVLARPLRPTWAGECVNLTT